MECEEKHNGLRLMTKRSTFFLFCLFFLFAGLQLSARTAAAQEPVPTPSDNEVNRVAQEMYCPVCENIPLDVCPTQACQEWRELIRLRLSEGWTEQEIKDYFAAQYGDRVLAEPPRRGLNWLVYILPVVAFVAGAGIVWRVILSMRRKAPDSSAAGTGTASAVPPVPTDDPYLAELEQELHKREKE
jgi:cytochrome c-type biogenesis protein CcmH